ncbi:SSD domain-containing protein [Meloidogyne graminicola]|uniref:SSD domain-containing protein n=1 Tax=Meloidogyne graminicola TaxID=189291 RepID=A0A8T0A023_9BILA|nr:SSD domain-containing protein [Meloidogyne graminicola]
MGSLRTLPNSIAMNNKSAIILCQSKQPSIRSVIPIKQQQTNKIKERNKIKILKPFFSSSSSSNWSDNFHAYVVNFYKHWAKFVIAHPMKIIIFCFILTIICSIKMIKTKRKNDIRGYTPYGSRSLYEFDVRDEFFGQTGTGIRFFILVLPLKENGTMLDEKVLDETVQVDTIVQKNLTIFNRKTNQEESFSQICRRFCTINDAVGLFANGWKEQQERIKNNEQLNENIKLNYPFSKIMGMNINIQPSFFGIHFGGKNKNYTNMEKVEMIVLLYRAERIGGWNDEDISNYEMSVSNYFKNYAQKEFDRSGKILISFVSIGLIVMCLCSLSSNSLSATFMKQFTLFKLPIALFSCLCPLMASGTALGLLFFTDLVRNSSILGITPFLILAIGIDDAFLMIHSWQMATNKRRNKNILPAEIINNNNIMTMEDEKKFKEKQKNQINLTLTKQLIEVLEETGPAIMISALTNISSDIIGSFTGSPEITLLCIGNIASIIVDFFYQITLFTSVLIICSRFELFEEIKNYEKNKITTIENAQINNNKFSFRNKIEKIFNKFISFYIKIVSNIWASIFICIIWIIILLICIRAMLKFEINLTTKKLFPPDSPLLEIENYREDKVLPFYTQAQIFVENPGDLTNKIRRRHLNSLIEEMEHLPNAYPKESTLYFVRAYEEFEKKSLEEEGENENFEEEGNLTLTTTSTKFISTTKMEDSQNFDLSYLENFFEFPENEHWRGLINYHTNDNLNNSTEELNHLDSMMVTVAYHGEELKDWHYRALMLNQWRSVVDKYNKEFNVSVLHDDGLYLDLLENMPTDIWQSAAATLVCMAIICAIFMGSNFFVVCVTTGVIASICAETLGILALTGMSMDPVLMSAVIISIGFSVDIPAHVSYHFHTAKWEDEDINGNHKIRKTPRNIPERVKRAFSSVGFPALQASACTNACAIALLFLPLYIAQVFARVIFTCITLGTIHSLFLLPALFTIVASIEKLVDKCTGNDKVKVMGVKKSLKKQNSSFRI